MHSDPMTFCNFISGDPQLEFAQWAAALHLATMWSFDGVREMIIAHMDKTIETADAFDRIDTSLKCRVEKWLHPAYAALCKRTGSLTDEEVDRLGVRRSTAIWRIRESLMLAKIQLNPACPSCGSGSGRCRSCGLYWDAPVGSNPNNTQNDKSTLDRIRSEVALNFV